MQKIKKRLSKETNFKFACSFGPKHGSYGKLAKHQTCITAQHSTALDGKTLLSSREKNHLSCIFSLVTALNPSQALVNWNDNEILLPVLPVSPVSSVGRAWDS